MIRAYSRFVGSLLLFWAVETVFLFGWPVYAQTEPAQLALDLLVVVCSFGAGIEFGRLRQFRRDRRRTR